VAGEGAEARADCTDSYVAPVLDTAFFALQTVRVGHALASDESAYAGATIGRTADLALGATFAAVGLVSALYGYDSVSACNVLTTDVRAERDFRRALRSRPPPSKGGCREHEDCPPEHFCNPSTARCEPR
jgi:hypothetical protein